MYKEMKHSSVQTVGSKSALLSIYEIFDLNSPSPERVPNAVSFQPCFVFSTHRVLGRVIYPILSLFV